MSIPVQCLLRLPACVRRQAILDILPRRQSPLREHWLGGNIAVRGFGSTVRMSARRRYINSEPNGGPKSPSHIIIPELKTIPTPPPKPVNHTAPPTPRGFAPSYLESLFAGAQGPILIYQAPTHSSFRILAFGSGLLFLVGALSTAAINQYNPVTKERRPQVPWYVQVLETIPPFFLVLIGTAMLIAPTRQIKSIKAVAPVRQLNGQFAGPATLQCELRNTLPFWPRTKTLETKSSDVFLSRSIAGDNISYASVPVQEVSGFTASYTGKPVPNSLSPFRAFSHNVRRMLLHDGFAHLRFKDYGRWKIDLQGCHIVDHGSALQKLTTPDNSPRLGLLLWIKDRLNLGRFR